MITEDDCKGCAGDSAGCKRNTENNGVDGCNRYIISQCNSALNVLEVYGLF